MYSRQAAPTEIDPLADRGAEVSIITFNPLFRRQSVLAHGWQERAINLVSHCVL